MFFLAILTVLFALLTTVTGVERAKITPDYTLKELGLEEQLNQLLSSEIHKNRRLAELSTDHKRQILNKHNTLRTQTATGGCSGHPMASNMNQLVWDNGLGATAQQHVDQCIWSHSSPSWRTAAYATWQSENPGQGISDASSSAIGENLAISTAQDLSDDQLISTLLNLVQDWYDEWGYYDFDAQTCETGEQCNHYCQMVWAETTHIGCGWNQCEGEVEGLPTSGGWADGTTYLVCHYYVAGNVGSQFEYLVANNANDICSECDSSGVCVDGLCTDCASESDCPDGLDEISEITTEEPTTEEPTTTNDPTTQEPTTEEPTTEEPTTEEPTTEEPTTEQPTEEPTTEEPTTEQPTTQEPTTTTKDTTAEEPTTEEPTTEEPTTKEPTTEEPTTEEPTSEEPTTEESTTDEPTTDEPTTEEPTTEEPTTEEPTTEEPTTEEPTTEEPTTEEPTTEEPTTEEPTTEEPTTTEKSTTTDEPTTDEPTTDEPTTEEPTTEEPTTTENPTTEEPTTQAPATTLNSNSCSYTDEGTRWGGRAIPGGSFNDLSSIEKCCDKCYEYNDQKAPEDRPCIRFRYSTNGRCQLLSRANRNTAQNAWRWQSGTPN